MLKHRACANTPALSRRRFLVGAVLASPAPLSVLAATEHSQIMRLFGRHQKLKGWLDKNMDSLSEDQANYHLDCLFKIEEEMETLPSQSAADFAAKFIAVTNNGQICIDPEFCPVWAEARMLVSI